jgi:hypothetical protein
VTRRKANNISDNERDEKFAKNEEDHPLAKSLREILREIDDQYERERQSLIKTLPNTSVKDRALAMLEARHHQRRDNYLRELAALLEAM